MKVQLKESEIRDLIRGILNEEMNELHPLTRINYANKRSEQYMDELCKYPADDGVSFDIPEDCGLVELLMSQGYYEDTEEAINCIKGAFENIYYDIQNGDSEHRAFDNAMQELYLDRDHIMDVIDLYYKSLNEPENVDYDGRTEDDVYRDWSEMDDIRNQAETDLINASNVNKALQVARDHRAGKTRYEGGKWFDGAGKEIPESIQKTIKKKIQEAIEDFQEDDDYEYNEPYDGEVRGDMLRFNGSWINKDKFNNPDFVRGELNRDDRPNDGSGFKDGELAMMAMDDKNEYNRKFAKQCKSNSRNARRDYDEGYWDGEYSGDVMDNMSENESYLRSVINSAVNEAMDIDEIGLPGDNVPQKNETPKLESRIVGNNVHMNESDIRRYIRECLKKSLNEEGGMGGATSGAGMFTGTGVDDAQYTVPFGGVQRRKKDKAFDRTPGNIAMNGGFKGKKLTSK